MTDSSAIMKLKMALGKAGRADFKTDQMGADLLYPEEQVAIFVMHDVLDAPPDEANLAMRRRVEARSYAREELDKYLRDTGWGVYRTYEREVVGNLGSVVENILAILAACRAATEQEYEALKNEMQLARLAKVDVISRSTPKAWPEFLGELSLMGNTFNKYEVWDLLSRKGWDEEIFNDVWDAARHHDVIRYDKNRFHPGRLLRSCYVDAGLGGEKDGAKAV